MREIYPEEGEHTTLVYGEMSLGAMLEEADIHGVKFVLQGDKTNPIKQPVAVQGEERLLQKELDRKRKLEEEEAQDADKRQKITEEAERSRRLLEDAGYDQFTGYTGPFENVKCNHCKTPWQSHKASKTKDSNSSIRVHGPDTHSMSGVDVRIWSQEANTVQVPVSFKPRRDRRHRNDATGCDTPGIWVNVVHEARSTSQRWRSEVGGMCW